MIAPSFFGHMIQGDWVADDGSLYQPVTVYFGLLRLWDSRAVWHKMVADTTALEANIRYAESRKARVMFTFGEPPESAIESGYRKVPTLAAWTAFVDRIATTPGVDILEGWNEPAYPQYWDGTLERLVALQKVLYERANGKLVLSPSFTRVELPDGQEFLERFKAAGGFQYCDAVAWHGYCARPEDLRGQIASLKTFTTLPLWNTEYVVGPTASEAERQDYMKRSLIIQAELGIECAVWNAEIPGSEDYQDDTMWETYQLLKNAPSPQVLARRKGCFR